MRGFVSCLSLAIFSFALISAEQPELVAVEGHGLRIQKGFKVSLFSDHTLANDIYCMTLDSKGRVVVSSAGWIKTLIDDNGDGKADRAEPFAKIGSGAMGLYFNGNDLLAVGDGALLLYRDADGDGKADNDGKPEKLMSLAGGEHGAHGIRKGPDGYFYLIGGNDTKFSAEKHVTSPTSPIKVPETGCILRISPDFKTSEVIAHGLRNPYDFDFNANGDIFLYDSDCERDFVLPWYTPTRIYHAAIGQHHGWRLPGYLRSYCRLDYYPDNVDILQPLGRGSPTGVTVYRHTQFPDRFQDGVFALDWTFGKVWFMPLTPKGASYTTHAEVFLEPTGSEGFAPTDAVVAPDGGMYVSIGGRRTKGSVFKIDPIEKRAVEKSADPLLLELNAPQPLESWSRATWEPKLKSADPAALEKIVEASDAPVAARVRAIEALTEFHKGVSAALAKKIAESTPTGVVAARLAWSIGQLQQKENLAALNTLAASTDAAVRRNALESLVRLNKANADARIDLKTATVNEKDTDKRVRGASSVAIARLLELKDHPLAYVNASTAAPTTPAKLAILHGYILSGARVEVEASQLVLAADKEDTATKFDALRLFIRALGDCNLPKPSKEIYSNYELPVAPDKQNAEIKLAVDSIRKNLGSIDEKYDIEAARLLAMFDDENPESVSKIFAKISPTSNPTNDIHYLICLSKLGGTLPDALSEKVAGALLGLSGKLAGQEMRDKQVWSLRVADLVELFSARLPGFTNALVAHADFVKPAHVTLAEKLGGEQRIGAAKRFAEAAAKDAKFPWSEPIIKLLSGLPAETVQPLLRSQWSNFGLRDSIIQNLASKPDASDRAKFHFGLEAANYQIVDASLKALEALPKDASGKDALALVKLLQRLAADVNAKDMRARVTKLLARDAGQEFKIQEKAEKGTTPREMKQAYEPVFAWFNTAFPKLAEDLKDSDDNPEALHAQMKDVKWDAGDVARGEAVFRDRGCQVCHAVQGALGPSLNGSASRFSKEDLFEAIALPSKDVAPLFKTTTFKMKDGQIVTGLIAFDSADGYIVQTGATTTVRVNTPDIVFKRPSTQSLMPQGLLAGLKPEQMADLYAYLRSLK